MFFYIKGLDDTLNLIKLIGMESPLKDFLKSMPYNVKERLYWHEGSFFQGDSVWKLSHQTGYQINITHNEQLMPSKMLSMYYLENENIRYLFNNTSTTILSYFVSSKNHELTPTYHELYKVCKADGQLKLEKFVSHGKAYTKEEKFFLPEEINRANEKEL